MRPLRSTPPSPAPPAPRWHYRYPGAYLAQIRSALAAAAAGRRVQLYWAGPTYDLAGLHEQIQRALHRRINLKAGLPEDGGSGRRWTPEYDTQQRRDAWAIGAYRIQRFRLDWIYTPEIRRRCTHLLNLDEEDDGELGGPVVANRRAILANDLQHRYRSVPRPPVTGRARRRCLPP